MKDYFFCVTEVFDRIAWCASAFHNGFQAKWKHVVNKALFSIKTYVRELDAAVMFSVAFFL